MTVELTVLISIACALGGLVIGVLTALRNSKKDREADGKQMGTILTNIGHIQKGVEDIQSRLKDADERYIDIATRLCKVEDSTKSAHKRIDHMEQKGA